MPMIAIRYVTPIPRPELRREIADFASRLGSEVLGKAPAVTVLLVEPADPESWFIAGIAQIKSGLSAFWLTITITEGTNTKAETTAFVNAAFAGMQALLGPLHDESYVYVQAVNGDAYGYGGRTQNSRWAAANPG